jgi:preprotein translocase subunit YajC
MRRSMTLLTLLGLSGSALADTTAAAPQQGGWEGMLVLPVIFVLFYLIFFLPQIRRNKQTKNMQNGLNTGDEVLTNAGFLGRVEKVSGNYVELALAKNVVIKIQKQAITQMVPKGTLDSM